MIILNVFYSCKPGTRDEVIKLAQDCVDKSRLEEGNITYGQYPVPGTDDDVFVCEVWESKEALAKHSQSDHYKAFGEARKPYAVPGKFKIKAYEAEEMQLKL